MVKRLLLTACAAVVLCATLGAQAGRAAAPQGYVEPVSLFRVRWGGGVYGGSVILTTDHAQVRALEKLQGAESVVLGLVFNRQMPSTKPLYRLAKQVGSKPSPERFYTTDKGKVDDLVNNHGWASEGILCYVYSGMDGGTKPLYHLSKSGEHFYTTTLSEMKKYKDVAGYKDEGVDALVLEHPFGWSAKTWMFADSTPGTAGPRPESYALVCRRGEGALFGKDGVSFKFTKGAEKAGAELAAGECAWPDRRMSPGEPDVLLAPFTNSFDPRSAHRDEEYWTFKVYNDGRGRMVVTGAEPGRPPAQVDRSIEVKRDAKAPQIKGPEVDRVRPVKPPRP